MNSKLFTFLFAAISFVGMAQTEVPNGNFEEWTLENTWTLEPEFWDTPNNQVLQVVEQDSMAYEGDFAMRVNPLQGFETAQGNASTIIQLAEVPGQLQFYVKCFVDPEALQDSVSVLVSFFDTDEFLPWYTVEWTSTSSIDEWSLVSLPLEFDLSSETQMKIAVRAGYNGFLGGGSNLTWISVDAMSFNNEVGVEETISCQDLNAWVSNGILQVSGCSSIQNVQLDVFDLSGRMIARGEGRELALNSVGSGVYLVKVYNQNGVVDTKKVVVR